MKDIDLVRKLATEYICPNTHQAVTQYEIATIKNFTAFGMIVLDEYKKLQEGVSNLKLRDGIIRKKTDERLHCENFTKKYKEALCKGMNVPINRFDDLQDIFENHRAGDDITTSLQNLRDNSIIE